MQKKLFCQLRLCVLVALFTLFNNPSFAGAYLVFDSYPWGQSQDVDAMDAVFGAGNWTQADFSTPAATIFTPSTTFVMLEGSDNNYDMPNFVSNNIALIENWVNNGGRLFMNAAPNYGGQQDWGFNNTTCEYGYFADYATTSVPGDPVFLGPYTPTATYFSGGSFAHAYIQGTGLTTLLYDDYYPPDDHPLLAYKTWGAGIVFFGGCTGPFAWSPSYEGMNLWYNIFDQVKTFPLTGINTTVSGAPWCAGTNITVDYAAVGLIFPPGNQFRVQLSDASGSFASPTQIGSLTSTGTSGSIVCAIPAAQPGGVAYRIRTVSTIPPFTGVDNGTDLVIDPQLTPSATVTANPGNSICAGTNVTFTASVINGGPSPAYQWKLNNVVVATTPSYSNAALVNGNFITCTITSNASCVLPATATSNTITMTVNPLLTPTVSVTSVPAANSICVGQLVTFTAAVTNAGPTPTYQWYKNGNPIGTNSAVYTDNVLNTNDIITCQLTSSAPCMLINPVTSTPVTVTVNPNVTTTISISANPGNSVCAGANTIFTATTTNVGPTPVYQWRVDGNPVGGNSPTYATTTLANNNVVTCTVTTSAACATPAVATSNSIMMTVNPVVTPTINITANPGNTICVGTNTTFTAAITNGGPAPTFQWTVNNIAAGNNSNTFISNTLANGDVVKCTLLSSAPCPAPASVSSSITMTVNTVLPASLGITVSPGTTICAGTLATFTANGINGGPAPVYQWYKNGNPVGANSAVYTDNTLNNTDVISCTMTSSATCAAPALSTSNNITMLVNATVTPAVSVSTNTGNTICAGTAVAFVASPVNGGNAPSYQWYLNGNPVPGNSPAYNNNTLANGDDVYCTMTSVATCATPATVTSAVTTMTVNPVNPTALTISVAPATTICTGNMATFTATGVNGGPSPVYEWYKNGNPVGGNSAVYNDNTLNSTDLIYCRMTSNATCATPLSLYSNSITMTVISNATPTIALTATPGTTICSGSPADFTAQTTNGGNSPSYQWKVNGNPVGGNAPDYGDNTLADGDVVSCEMTSSFGCASPAVVTASLTMMVNPVVAPSVTIASPVDTICAGGVITFNAIPVNGGPTPVYVWRKNGGPVGFPVDNYIDNNLLDNDVITCDLLSSIPCPTSVSVTSNAKTITVFDVMTPKVFLDADPSVLTCSGSPITFLATVDSAGTPPAISYQWMLNGNPVGSNTPSYADNMLNGGDQVYYIMTSTAPCLTKTVDTSAIDTIKWFSSGYLAGVTGITESNTINITAPNSLKVGYTDCDIISTITPSGVNPVSGITTFKVTIDPQVNNFNGQPYVQRHYDIDPQNNPATATATIELYAYLNEFVAYNNVAVPLGLPALPVNGVDNGNIRVSVFHGTGTAPGNYTGNVEEVTPVVSWDIANNWWVMSFPAAGFSGYYIHTGGLLSVSNTTAVDGFSMETYPNPVKDKVEVKLTGNKGANSSLVVTDLTGRIIINVDMGNNKAIIDMSGLASGMYMLRYTDDNRSQVVKITKQ